MIGVYDYTVVLTYLSAVFAGIGSLLSLSGEGHPYVGAAFLLFCGLFDTFDGKVARLKKDRSDYSRKFGVQIDSLADILAFGFLPICIGAALIRVNPVYHEPLGTVGRAGVTEKLFYGLMAFYLLMGLVRLAHYNVTEEERQEKEKGNRVCFQGVPITTAAIVFPLILLIQRLTGADLTALYFGMMLILAVLFVTAVSVPKPRFRIIMIIVGIGAVEFALFLLYYFR